MAHVYADVKLLQDRDRELARRVARLEAQLDELTTVVHAAAAEARGEAARISEEVGLYAAATRWTVDATVDPFQSYVSIATRDCGRFALQPPSLQPPSSLAISNALIVPRTYPTTLPRISHQPVHLPTFASGACLLPPHPVRPRVRPRRRPDPRPLQWRQQGHCRRRGRR